MIGMQVTTRTGATLTAVSVHSRRGTKPIYEWHCSACSGDLELWPKGQIRGTSDNLKRGGGCGCSPKPHYTAKQTAIRASRLVAELGWEFLGWAEDYRGNRTKCLIKCPKHGVSKNTQYANLARGSGCPRCRLDARNRTMRLEEPVYWTRIDEVISKTSWVRRQRVGVYAGQSSVFEMHCPKHGVFTSTYGAVIQGNFGCSGCSGYGFSQIKPAHLYCLRSNCGAYLKIGITHNLKARLKVLKKSTPFEFKLLIQWTAMGSDVWANEKMFHENFESAGLRGFDGATEWIKNNPHAISHFKNLPGAFSILD